MAPMERWQGSDETSATGERGKRQVLHFVAHIILAVQALPTYLACTACLSIFLSN
jgi:hypothetical protein